MDRGDKYAPEKTSNTKPEFARVTDRTSAEVLPRIGMTIEEFHVGMRVVVSGSGFNLNFERELHDRGVEVAIIDQSLSLTSDEYSVLVDPFDENGTALFDVATYALKKKQPMYGNRSDEQFDVLQRERNDNAEQVCCAVIPSRVPSDSMRNLIDIDVFIDCIGPAHYIDESEMVEYLQLACFSLKTEEGVLVIYPISNRPDAWSRAFAAVDGIVVEEFSPPDSESIGVKIRRSK